jgi:hypothetical protein
MMFNSAQPKMRPSLDDYTLKIVGLINAFRGSYRSLSLQMGNEKPGEKCSRQIFYLLSIAMREPGQEWLNLTAQRSN